MNTKERTLAPFIKATTLEEKVQIINNWEEDRCANAEEFIYDLKKNNERDAFIILYGAQTTQRVESIGRFWFGGNNYYANEEDKTMCRSIKIWCVNEENIDKTLNGIIDEIIDRYDEFIANPSQFQDGIKGAIRYIDELFDKLIDFKAFYESENKSKKYKWIAVSNDHSFIENEHHYGELTIDDLSKIARHIEIFWHRICSK